MSAVILLYGSRARGDNRVDSDIDIVVSEPEGGLKHPWHSAGLSVHFYPQKFLIDSAKNGDLFSGHLAYEAIAIYDDGGFLQALKQNFKLKASYAIEKKVAETTMRLLLSRDWQFSEQIRRRYFWALRTLGIASSAEKGKLGFSSEDIERELGVTGTARHINNRDSASYGECWQFALRLFTEMGWSIRSNIEDDINFLTGSGPIGLNTVEMFETEILVEQSAFRLYE